MNLFFKLGADLRQYLVWFISCILSSFGKTKWYSTVI